MSFVGWIFMVIGAASVSCFALLLMMVLLDFFVRRIQAPRAKKSKAATLFYCERCEQRTARRFTSLTATVVACGDHSRCGFRRCLRDELHPENVGVMHDPGSGKTPTPQE
ncbi:MAG: hypothetical protein V3T08_09260 [Gemmatimonadota bacterium]